MDQSSWEQSALLNKGSKMPRATAVLDDTIVQTTGATDSGVAHLEEDLRARLAQLAPTVNSVSRAMRCLHELDCIVEQIGCPWKVQPFGSFANGFGTLESDLDLTCCPGDSLLRQALDADPSECQQKATSALGTWILPSIQKHSSFEIVELILGARIPIIKLLFEETLSVDLSCLNPKPLLNTRLLRLYSRMDCRVKELVTAVKFWAKGVGVCDAVKSNLSSYAFTLLTIYFLQVHIDSSLPVVSTSLVGALDLGVNEEADEHVIAALPTWQCTLSLPELLIRFFGFYSANEPHGFAWGKEVVSVRLGSRKFKRNNEFAKLRGRQTNRIHIEDPFELERNLHGVLGDAEEERLRTTFGEAWHALKSAQLPPPLQLEQPPHDLPFDSIAFKETTTHSQHDQSATERVKTDLVDLIHLYKSTHSVDSSAGSTRSGGTVPRPGSDDESCTEGFSPDLDKIPLPWILIQSPYMQVEHL